MNAPGLVIPESLSQGQGNLKEHPFPILLAVLYRQRSSGILHLERAQDYSKIHFSRGVPNFVEAGTRNLNVGNLLLRLGKVSAEQLEQAAQKMAGSKKRIGEALVDLGVLSASDLDRLLKVQVKYKLLDCFPLAEGKYFFQDGSSPGKLPFYHPVFVENILWEGIKRYYKKDWLISQMPGDLAAIEISYAPDFSERAKFFGFTEEEAKYLDLVSTPKKLRAALKEDKPYTEKILQMLFALALTGMIRVQAGRPTADRDKKPSVKHETLEEKLQAPAVSSQEYRRIADIIEKKFLEYKKLSAFELLEVEDNAPAEAIRLKFRSLAKIYHPDTHIQKTTPEIKAKAEEIFKLMTHYYAILTDEEKRRQWEKANQEKAEEDAARLSAEAEKSFAMGKKSMISKSYDHAHLYFAAAARINPKKAAFLAYAGWTWYLGQKGGDKDVKMPKVLQCLEQALAADPNYDMTYYFQGVLAREAGRQDEAKKLFMLAAQKNPNNIDAKRELRLMEMREQKAAEEKAKKKK